MEKLSRTSTVLNRTSVKRYALKVSAERRAGKFTRVGEEFFLRCEARLESSIRGLASFNMGDDDNPVSEGTLITITARAKAAEILEVLSRRIIYSEVLRHPSIGVTLK